MLSEKLNIDCYLIYDFDCSSQLCSWPSLCTINSTLFICDVTNIFLFYVFLRYKDKIHHICIPVNLLPIFKRITWYKLNCFGVINLLDPSSALVICPAAIVMIRIVRIRNIIPPNRLCNLLFGSLFQNLQSRLKTQNMNKRLI